MKGCLLMLYEYQGGTNSVDHPLGPEKCRGTRVGSLSIFNEVVMMLRYITLKGHSLK